MKQHLEKGSSIAEAVKQIEEIEITGVEINLLQAGERGGLLPQVCENLARYFERLERSRKSIMSRMIYPVVLFHVAVLLPMLPKLLVGDSSGAIRVAFMTLAIGYGLMIAIYAGYQIFRHRAAHDAAADRVVGRVPLLGKVRKALALERFAQVFYIYLLAAFKPSESVLAAADASQSGRLRSSANVMSGELADGNQLGPLMCADRVFPNDFALAMATAEQSGTLDEELKKWSSYFSLEAEAALETFQRWLPKLFYAAVALYVAYIIVSLWMNYFNQFNTLLEM